MQVCISTGVGSKVGNAVKLMLLHPVCVYIYTDCVEVHGCALGGCGRSMLSRGEADTEGDECIMR